MSPTGLRNPAHSLKGAGIRVRSPASEYNPPKMKYARRKLSHWLMRYGIWEQRYSPRPANHRLVPLMPLSFKIVNAMALNSTATAYVSEASSICTPHVTKRLNRHT